MKRLYFTLMAAILIAGGIAYDKFNSSSTVPSTNSTITLADQPAKPAGKTLAEFTAQLLKTCRADLSEVRAKITVAQIVRITEATFTRRDQQESFMFLICIESKFNGAAHSKAGAVGFTQIMPKYADYFTKKCGLGKLGKDDLQDSEINLTVGACLFNDLLQQFDGNVALALSGYNSGPDSSTTKALSELQTGSNETSGYLAKFLVLKEKMK